MIGKTLTTISHNHHHILIIVLLAVATLLAPPACGQSTVRRPTTTKAKPTAKAKPTVTATTKATTKQSGKTNANTYDPDLTYVPRLQRLAERLLENRQGSIVALRPTTGEVLCMASNTLNGSPINRAVQATYPPGSTIKTAQLLTLYSEGIVKRDTKVACHRGFMMGGTHVGCHYHASPLTTVQALAQSCNSWFITNFIRMIADTTQGLFHLSRHRRQYVTM